MVGHPSVKKRQKEVARKERQAEKLARRDERRLKRNDPTAGGEADESVEGQAALELPAAEAPAPSDDAKPATESKP
jgi:hypothetical protein